MFESAALGRACSNKEFEEKAPQLRMRLFNAQLQCIERKIPVLITVAGLVGSGRGAIINLLSEWMDSKHVQNHVFWLVTDEEKSRPWPWRFWRQLPAAGQTAVFYDGWYGEAMRQRCCKDVGENEFTASMHRWQALESGLAESGMAIIKLWLHLNKKDHARALKERQENRALVHFSPSDKKIAADYDGMVSAASRAIMLTDRDNAPWSIIDAADPNFRNLSVVKAIIAGIERTIAAHDARAARLKVLESVPEVEEDARLKAGMPPARGEPSGASLPGQMPASRVSSPSAPLRMKSWRTITCGVSGGTSPAPVSSPSMTAPGTAVSLWNGWKS